MFNCCSKLKEEVEELKKEMAWIKYDLKKCVKLDQVPITELKIANIITHDDIKKIQQEMIDLYEYIRKNRDSIIPLDEYRSMHLKLQHFKEIRATKWRQGGTGLLGWLDEGSFEINLKYCIEVVKTIHCRESL